MKANTFLKNILDRTGTVDAELEAKINSFQGDLPDELEAVLNKVTNADAAKTSREIADYHKNHYKSDIDRVQTAKLTAKGFSQEEITQILSLDIAERSDKLLELQDAKLRKTLNITESDAVKQANALAQAEKERADRLQNAYLDKGAEVQKAVQEVELKHNTISLISGFPIANSIPRSEAVNLIYSKVSQNLEAMGAKLIMSAGSPKLVNAKDVTLDFYDANSNRVDAHRFVEKIIADLNLLERKQQTQQQKEFQVSLNKPVSSQAAFKSTVNKILQK